MSQWRLWAGLAFLSAASLVIVAAAPAQKPAPALKIPPGFDLAAGMTALYGNYDPASRSSSIVAPHGTSGPIEKENVRIFFVEGFRDSDEDQILLATFAVPATGRFKCRDCRPLIGEALFRRTGEALSKTGTSGWTVEASRLPDFAFGEWGKPPRAEIVQFGPHQFGIELSVTASAQGERVTETSLLAPWAGSFTNVFQTEAEDNNLGACPPKGTTPCHAYVSLLKFAPGDNPDYYDLLVETFGTRLTNGAIEDISYTKHLRFADGRYF
ncbi:MAG: hypothetical protein WA175_00180 [Candidatus Acidiferrales bacterium]